MLPCCHLGNKGTTGGQQEKKRTTTGGHRVGQRGQRTKAGPQEEDTGLASAARGQQQDICKRQEDKRRTRGWPARPEDNSRTTPSTRGTRGGQGEDKTRTQRSGARPATVASSFFQERTPTVDCLGKPFSIELGVGDG